MAEVCTNATNVLVAGFITIVLFYLLSWINKGSKKVVRKIRGKPIEPIECKITELVSYVNLCLYKIRTPINLAAKSQIFPTTIQLND
jgi:hypothetical protein